MVDTDQLRRLPGSLRVTHQPVMVAGLSGTEFILVISLGFTTFCVACGISYPILGAFHLSLLVGSLAGTVAGMVLRAMIVRAKRQKPEGYPMQVALRLRHGIEPFADLLSEEGPWDPMRHGR